MSKFDHDSAAAYLRSQISTFDKPWYESCVKVVEDKAFKGLNCLDLCCGNGEFSQILRDRFKMNVVCADYIPLHLEKVRSMGFSTIEIDLEGAEDQVSAIAQKYSHSFDLVVNLAAIEHIFNTGNLLSFTHRVLKDGGYFLVNTPNISFLAYHLYSLFDGRPFGEGHHIRFWNYRFLRTHLFLFGFDCFEDHSAFHSIPYDPMLRAFRNNRFIARIVSSIFMVCKYMQHVPLLKGVCADELTVLSRKVNAPIIGFEYNDVVNLLRRCSDLVVRKKIIDRLVVARNNGWLDEHLYLAKLVDENKGAEEF